MLDKDRDYVYRYVDDDATWQVLFYWSEEDNCWIRSESHCGHGQADFWTSPSETYCDEQEVIDEVPYL